MQKAGGFQCEVCHEWCTYNNGGCPNHKFCDSFNKAHNSAARASNFIQTPEKERPNAHIPTQAFAHTTPKGGLNRGNDNGPKEESSKIKGKKHEVEKTRSKDTTENVK
jgi:hypothetical protein